MSKKKELRQEIEPSQRPIVVIIDDNGLLYEKFFQGLKKNNLDIVAPTLTSSGDILGRLEVDLVEALNNADFSRVALVIADQFYDNYESRRYTHTWLSELRAVNKDAVVVETSFWPKHFGTYDAANPVMHSMEFDKLRRLFENVRIKDKEELLDFGKRLGNLAFREAQKCDPNSSPNSYTLKDGYDALRSHEKFPDLLGVVSRDDNEIRAIEYEIHNRSLEVGIVDDLTKDALIVHTAFVIIFHLERESDLACYSIAITRLRGHLRLD